MLYNISVFARRPVALDRFGTELVVEMECMFMADPSPAMRGDPGDNKGVNAEEGVRQECKYQKGDSGLTRCSDLMQGRIFSTVGTASGDVSQTAHFSGCSILTILLSSSHRRLHPMSVRTAAVLADLLALHPQGGE